MRNFINCTHTLTSFIKAVPLSQNRDEDGNKRLEKILFCKKEKHEMGMRKRSFGKTE
jgi:hypothetical protein